MDQNKIADLISRYGDKETDELLQIWETNDKASYTEEAFEAIRQILVDRKCDLSRQTKYLPALDETANYQKIIVSDVDIPIASLIIFMIKWAIASIPAMFILGAIAFIFLLIVDAISHP